jgi:hypothetical protein
MNSCNARSRSGCSLRSRSTPRAGGSCCRTVARRLQIGSRDAYLQPFSDLAPHSELVEALELACRVGKVARALTWARAVAQSNPSELTEHFATAPLASLRSLLAGSYLGGA